MLNTCVLSKHQKHNKCLRDTSGILFRLHALVEDGEVQIGERHRFLLRDAVESVLAPFEGERAKSHSIDGHFVGAMYMQAVTAYLSASSNATSTTALCSLVRRVGQASCFGCFGCFCSFRPSPAGFCRVRCVCAHGQRHRWA